MKRNMVPLLGIAFVVAIISTGVFYGLFAGKLRSSSELPGHAIVVAARDLERGTVLQIGDLRVSEVQGVLGGAFSKPEEVAGATLLTPVKTNEPLLEERVAPRVSEATGGSVPTGMRAITMHIFQSESLLSFLRPGSRVDLQAVSEKNGAAELRTVLENVQVLAVSSPDANGNRPAGAAAVTVLIRAQDADLVALADAGSRVRLALRNPLDQQTTPRHALTLGALFTASNKPDSYAPAATHPTSPVEWDHPVQLHVRVLEASDAALAELRAQSDEISSGLGSHLPSDDAWRVSAFRSSEQASKLMQSLEHKHQLEVVSSERLTAGVGRPISYHAGAKPFQLRVRFSPEWLTIGKLGLELHPQMDGPGLPESAKKFEAGLADASSFWVQGFVSELPGQNSPARLFPARSWDHKHLVIFVSARTNQQTSSVAEARNILDMNRQDMNRGQ
jgi:Flp pilus assembly protein CpaB